MFNYSIRAVYRFHFSCLLDKWYWFCTLMQHETVLSTIRILKLVMCISYGNWAPCWRKCIFQIFTMFKFPGDEKIFKDIPFMAWALDVFSSCFSTCIYACYYLYIFKTNGLCNIFSVNSIFIVVISCTDSSLLNNFTIVSSYLHAILMNKIPFVKNKNYVPQACLSLDSKNLWGWKDRKLLLFFLELSVFLRRWLLSHIRVFLLLSLFYF